MASVNKVILIGYLGADPEVKQLEGDNAVANVNLATSESYKDRNGNKVDQTEWHSLEFWGNQAKIAGQYLKKGAQIYVEGKIKTETWEDKEGNKRYRTKIRVNSMTMLGSKDSGQSDNATHAPREEYQTASNGNSFQATQQQVSQAPDLISEMQEDDLPF
jgi:single-strand DNA-binding protein